MDSLQKLNDFNWKIEIFLRDLKKFQQEVNKTNPCSHELLSDAIIIINSIINESTPINDQYNGNSANSALFEVDENNFDINQFITCRICCIQIPLSKKDYVNHISSVYHTSKITRMKFSSIDKLNENKNFAPIVNRSLSQSTFKTISNGNSMESIVSIGNQSKISVESKTTAMKKPVPNVFDDRIFSFIENKNGEKEFPALLEKTIDLTQGSSLVNQTTKIDQQVTQQVNQQEKIHQAPTIQQPLPISNSLPSAAQAKGPIEIISCDAINKGIKGESAMFKPMTAFAFNNLYEDFPHLNPCGDILAPLKDKINTANNTNRSSRDVTPQRNSNKNSTKVVPKSSSAPKANNANSNMVKSTSKPSTSNNPIVPNKNNNNHKTTSKSNQPPKQPTPNKPVITINQKSNVDAAQKPTTTNISQPSVEEKMSNNFPDLSGINPATQDALFKLLAQIVQQKGKQEINSIQSVESPSTNNLNSDSEKEIKMFFNRDLVPHMNHYICRAESICRSLWHKMIQNDLESLISTKFTNVNSAIIGSRCYKFAQGRSILDLHLDLDQELEIIREIEKLMNVNLSWTETAIDFDKLEINTKHKTSGTLCNIKFGNQTSVYNSALVDILLDVQPLMRQVATCLRLLLDEISTDDGLKCSGYTILLLVIFYFQQNNYLPSVDKMQNGCIQKLCEGNSVEFKRCTGVKICSDRFRDILIAFFKFYANFDFRRYIISVFYGKAIDRPNDIENVHNKTSSGHSKNTDGVAIQDIFDHNKNISQTIPFQKIEKFQQICKESVEFLSEFGDSLRY